MNRTARALGSLTRPTPIQADTTTARSRQPSIRCGVPIEALAAALAVRQGSPRRMEVHHVPGDPVLAVDCFNAIPASAEAAVRSLAALPGERKLAVLGLMAELGDRSESEHRRIALVAQELGIDVVGYETRLYARRT
jgi:UDP-N-acetylmuramoyl-tripeptide--D-alanyl-D-alanine ligase